MKKFFNIAFVAAALTVAQSPVLAQVSVKPFYVYSSNGERGPLIDPESHAAIVDAKSGDMLLEAGEGFLLEYRSRVGAFRILLSGSNLRESRLAGERDLLALFQITQDQACNLKVRVEADILARQSQLYAGRNLGLSFCKGSVSLRGINSANW